MNDRFPPPGQDREHETLTTNQGCPVANNQDQLTAGPRGGTLMEDFIFREKMTQFDHERIPERVVHARGSAAHGVFRVYDDSMKEFTRARFLTDPSLETETFTRFSTVVGSRGSADTVRDVRGFATKFYTVEGVYDLVGNNIPVFFIQDGMKFPDLVHSIKPEPHHEMPQASAAHDTFWDFISLTPEAMHMVMWVLSDRALPTSYAKMEGFGVHTFRLTNAEGRSTLCKIHWKPTEGLSSLVWDETQKIAGKNPDFNRKDLWERIEQGTFPEFELGLQLFTEEEAAGWDFDVLDATKIVPEELVPVRRVGKMTLNRNPDNFFAETEQVAFHPGHLVPGIDFTNDPLLQARLFSYLDTQLNRFGGVNFHQVPINRPRCPVFNNNQDGFMRMEQDKGRVNYEPNSLAGGKPHEDRERGFTSHPEPQEGVKTRGRPESFDDHFSQAELFWNSQSEPEREHLVEAIKFELGKVEHMHIRERMIQLFYRVSPEIAERAAPHVGVEKVDGDISYLEETTSRTPRSKLAPIGSSPALSMERSQRTARGRKVAILVAAGVAGNQANELKQALKQHDVTCEVVAPMSGRVETSDGSEVMADHNFSTAASVLFDAVYVPGGTGALEKLKSQGDAVHFVNEAFKHCKPVAASGDGVGLLEASNIVGVSFAEGASLLEDKGVLTTRADSAAELAHALANALGQHRFWQRDRKDEVPA
ncbi:MAG: catalase [Fimbriimonadaceae bacterium]|nr:catalase [Fimbriimonadaceae bacterium]QYK55002.1 MAG: catalase [Fimbriimonadaceae bacterium]